MLPKPFVAIFSCCPMLLGGIICKISVVLDAQRAGHNCIQTPTFSNPELALQLFGVPVGAQLRAVVCGSGSKSKQPKIPCNRLQSGPPTKLL
ncbi:MAG: hypothetical protein ACKPKO_25490 [Candidatus Fonsibacter sp.]